MNILSFVHGYPPDHNHGAEYMLHEINKHLISQGHEAKVMLRNHHGKVGTIKNNLIHVRNVEPCPEYEGVRIHREGVTMYNKLFMWADLIITHLDRTGKAINLSRMFGKKLIHLIHNTRYNDMIVKVNGRNHYVIYNSNWVRDTLKYPMKGCVLHPAIDYEDYQTEVTGDNITLTNCFAAKGGNILIELARAMPKRKFIGIMGYGNQIIGTEKNIKYIENTSDIKSIYAQSRIVIMPSEYESFGRVAIEASASGIPVIVNDTPGLRESLEYAGVFIKSLSDIDEWVKAIKKLDNEAYYKKIGVKGIKRAKEITANSKKELARLIEFFEMVLKEKYHVV